MNAKEIAEKLKAMNALAKTAMQTDDIAQLHQAQALATALQQSLDEAIAVEGKITKPFLTVNFSSAYGQYVIMAD